LLFFWRLVLQGSGRDQIEPAAHMPDRDAEAVGMWVGLPGQVIMRETFDLVAHIMSQVLNPFVEQFNVLHGVL
jgi:hypothetical protein